MSHGACQNEPLMLDFASLSWVLGRWEGLRDMTGGTLGTLRNPWLVILFSLITFGIYNLYWQYATFKEMKQYSGEGIGGGLGLLFAFLLGIVNVFLMPSEVGNIYASEGKDKPVSGVTGFWMFLPIVGWFIWTIKTQGSLNRNWESHGAVA